MERRGVRIARQCRRLKECGNALGCLHRHIRYVGDAGRLRTAFWLRTGANACEPRHRSLRDTVGLSDPRRFQTPVSDVPQHRLGMQAKLLGNLLDGHDEAGHVKLIPVVPRIRI